MADELGIASTYINGLLKTDSTLVSLIPDDDNTNARVFADGAPEDIDTTYVVWQFSAKNHSGNTQGQRIIFNSYLDISVYGAKFLTCEAISPVFSRVDDLLKDATGSQSGKVITVRSEFSWRNLDYSTGVSYPYYKARYSIEVA